MQRRSPGFRAQGPYHTSGWPAALVALMASIRRGDNGSIRFACRLLGITDEIAWELYDLFEAREWHSERAHTLIAGLRTRTRA